MTGKIAKFKQYGKVFLTHLFSHVGLCGLVVGYAIVGALTFEYLESNHELTQRSTIQGFRTECLMDLWDITDKLNVLHPDNWTAEVGNRLKVFEIHVVNAVKNEGYDGKETEDPELQWSFSGALLYSITVITTIGYGNIAPKTDTGKVVTIFYALLGIPLMLLCLTNIGDLLARSFKFTYSHLSALFRSPRRQLSQKHKVKASESKETNCLTEKSQITPPESVTAEEEVDESPSPPRYEEKKDIDSVSTPPLSPVSSMKSQTNNIPTTPPGEMIVVVQPYDHDDYEKDRVPIYMVFLLVTAYICGGATLFSLWEKWSFLNGAYFCFITLSTIGFGDLVPGTATFDTKNQSGQAKLIICCFYLILGLSVIAMAFNLVQEEVIIKCKNLGRNLGILNDAEDES